MLFSCSWIIINPDVFLCCFPVSGLLPCVPGHRQNALLAGSPGRPHRSTSHPHHGGLQQPHQSQSSSVLSIKVSPFLCSLLKLVQFCFLCQSQSSSVLSSKVSPLLCSLSKLVYFCSLCQSQSSSVLSSLYHQPSFVLSVKVSLVLFSLSVSLVLFSLLKSV